MSKFGCIKDKLDHRDYKLTRMTVKQSAALPKSIDYSDKMSPVGNQLNEGTCVGFACIDGMKEYQDKIERNKYIDLSVRYVYWNAKQIDDAPNEEGTYIRCAMDTLLNKGVCPEYCWRYVPNINLSPCGNADELAAEYKIEGYWRIDSVQAMKESLVVNGPFVVGLEVFGGFEFAPKGVVPMPTNNERPIGGHAVCVVGYDDNPQPKRTWWQQLISFFKRLFNIKEDVSMLPSFRIKNSWGKIWGDSGYGYISYEYMEKYFMDAWSAKDKLGGQ